MLRPTITSLLAAVAFQLGLSISAHAGPEITLREFASGQIKKGVRSIGMGGDGATWGNYALVYRDSATAVADYGVTHFSDTGDSFTFAAAGFASPKFWDDAVLFLIALSQHAVDVQTWTLTPASGAKPPSVGDGSNEAIFVKVAKPLSDKWSLGFLFSYELSQMTLNPFDGSRSIRFQTAWRPSGGAGLAWQPVPTLLAGVRVILNHDWETRTDANGVRSGMARSYEYRAGVSVLPWDGGLLDAGLSILDRSNAIEASSSFKIRPTLGAEQAVVARRLWLRAGLDESSPTAGASLKVGSFKADLAYVRDLGAERTNDVFGKHNSSGIVTLTYEF